MKTIPFQSSINGSVASVVTCWKVIRKDGEILGFTDHSEPITFDSVTFEAKSGYSRSAIDSNLELSVSNLEIESIFDSSGITEQDLVKGRYDGARIEVYLVNWQNVSERVLYLKATLGECKNTGEIYTAELRALSDKLNQNIANLTSRSCRYQFGDSRCGINLASHTWTGTVAAVASRQSFELSDTAPTTDNYFNEGTVTFTSGNNEGVIGQVLGYNSARILTLWEPAPYTITVGDSLTVTTGCNRELSGCQGYSNVVNFGGEPHVPGADKVFGG